jgi:hydrophobe/amphiphile efflux-1 (HAE1) family protein
MKFSHFFIERPIFAAVVSLVIVIVGAIAFFTLPVAQYPQVVPPTVVVSTSYPGATPETISETVATPLEQEINGVEDMLYMSSQSTSDGAMSLTITFKIGTDLDKAQMLVQNRAAVATPRLPIVVQHIGVTTRKSLPDLLMVVHLLSPDNTYDQLYISNYALLQVRDELARVDGVGDIQLYGAREYSMRAWLDPERLGSLNITADDVTNALRAQNVEVAAGALGAPPVPRKNAFQLQISAQGRLEKADQFGNIIIKTGTDGRITRLRDVARVELGARDYSVNSYLGKDSAVAMVVLPRPGSNALSTAHSIRDTMRTLSQRFPKGLEYRIVYDPTIFVQNSIDAVIHTIFEAVFLVVVVVILFLQTWRASIIPLLAIPVSLIGTFAVMAALGFSLNSLTLFGLVLAIGIVVDDAIVVVENIERNLELGLSPPDAARRAMDEVGGAVVAIALVLSSVFIPTAFMSGISGQFYRQFALTIAVATIISAFVSLTLSPALGALLLRRDHSSSGGLWNLCLGWLFRGFNRGFSTTTKVYVGAVSRLARKTAFGLILYGGLLALTFFEFQKVPVGFIPAQDQGYVIISVQLPDGASLDRTDAVVKQIRDVALSTPGIINTVAFTGFSGATRTNATNAAAIFPVFDDFEKRANNGLTGAKILTNLRAEMAKIQGASVVVIPPPPVRGLGTAGGFQMYIQDRSAAGLSALQAATDKMVGTARQTPGLTSVFTTFRAGTPRLYADIDRTKAEMLNVPVQNVFDALQVYFGSLYVNDFNLFGRTYRVTLQADQNFRQETGDLRLLKTRSTTGAMVPLSSVLDLKRIGASDRVVRYNLFPAAPINGDSAAGFSSGQSIATMEKLANETLPRGMSFQWTDLAFQQQLAGNTALYIFPLCVLFVFLTLAAQYESWSLPFIIILIVPMSLLSSITGVWLRGLDNNILTQIGFVVLVGLACKNAILIVEFAKQQEEAGSDPISAAIEACRLRLRPILMTSFAFILGVVPLLVAKGAGAEMRQALGTAVFSGMLGVTFFGLFLTPIFYVVIRHWTIRRALRGKRPDDDRRQSPEREVGVGV